MWTIWELSISCQQHRNHNGFLSQYTNNHADYTKSTYNSPNSSTDVAGVKASNNLIICNNFKASLFNGLVMLFFETNKQTNKLLMHKANTLSWKTESVAIRKNSHSVNSIMWSSKNSKSIYLTLSCCNWDSRSSSRNVRRACTWLWKGLLNFLMATLFAVRPSKTELQITQSILTYTA